MMSNSVVSLSSAVGLGDSHDNRSGAVPWYLWTMMYAVTSLTAGIYWDISWHQSIGRDSFLIPPHIAVYLAAIVAGGSSAWLIFSLTFRSSEHLRDSISIKVFGLRGPLGAFVGAWGCCAMLCSAPLDNWWHSAYGIDVKIQSPPHAVLQLGIIGLVLSAVLMIIGSFNRSSGPSRRSQERLLMLVGGCVMALEYLAGLGAGEQHELMHSSAYYNAFTVMLFPIAAIATACDSRWALTKMALIYTVMWLTGLWFMPLFAATPRLGPVYHHITHFLPLGFPALLIFPSIATDAIRMGPPRASVKTALIMASVFLLVFIAAQWPFGTFLNSPAARNRIFGRNYFAYFDKDSIYNNPYRFINFDGTSIWLLCNMARVAAGYFLSIWLGLHFGEWLRRARR